MNGKKIIITDEQSESIRKLNNVLRNQFIHFRPINLLVELNGLPKIALDVLDIIEILSRHTFIIFDLTNKQKNKIKSNINQSKRHLQTLSL